MAGAGLVGGYDFLGLLARVMETDLDPLFEREPPADAVRLMNAHTASLHARSSWADVYETGTVTAMPAAAARVLFHERVHYWQQLSTPALQLKFMTHLDALSLAVARMGGTERWIASSRAPGTLDDPRALAEETEEMRIRSASAAADWATRSFAEADISGPSPNPIDADTAMPFLMLPHPESETVRLPAYGAILRFEGSARIARVPFTALYLLEAAAHLCEHLFAGEGPPASRVLEDEQDDLYLGAWEFWRRAHGERYDDDLELALAFLAAVDFAVVAHSLDAQGDSETMAELTSIPYRFGKVAYRTRGFDPLERQGREPADAIAAFQDAVCRWTGLPSQRETLKSLAVAITRMLVMSVSRHLDERAIPVVQELFRTPLAEAGDRLEPAWELIREAVAKGPQPIGADSLGQMLNATVYRLEHPGVLAAPYAYADQLSAALPLPAVQHQGKLLFEEAVFRGSTWTGPYPREPVQLLTDVVGLTAVKPLLEGRIRCGYVEDGIECSYMAKGLGCPQRGLTSDEQWVRARSGLEDFCHFIHRTVLLGVAPDGAQERWMATLRGGTG